MIGISEALSVFDESTDLPWPNNMLIHTLSELWNNRTIKFFNGYDLFVQLYALVIFTVEPLLPTLPFQLLQKTFDGLLLL